MVNKERIVRWRDWEGEGIEHLVLTEKPSLIVAEGTVLGGSGEGRFAVHYRMECDPSWTLRAAEVSLAGDDRKIVLTSDGRGRWRDRTANALSNLDGAIDIDLSISPFTNTLPIRRLNLSIGQSERILAVYVRLPEFSVTTDPQRYTCLRPLSRYRYESLDSYFVRDIEVDEDGLVVTYPGLFKRLD